jgi:hypothetical protein
MVLVAVTVAVFPLIVAFFVAFGFHETNVARSAAALGLSRAFQTMTGPVEMTPGVAQIHGEPFVNVFAICSSYASRPPK